jgi:UDP-glucose 4-epimerase
MIAHGSHHDPIEALRVNVMGTGYLFEAAARLINQPRIVYATSVGVYGAPKLYANIVDEDSPVAPGMIYGATKAMNEGTAAHYLRAYGLPSTGLRPTMAYGPGRYVGALGEINLAIKNAVLGEAVTWN